MKKQQICILGSTGSIGTQALDVIEQHSDLYEVYCLTANNRVKELAEQAHKFHPAAVVIANENHYEELQDMLSDEPDIKVYAGAKALCDIVQAEPIDMVLASMVGFSGLEPTIHAIKAHKKICLANKETLVVAGELICNLAQEYHVPILPVDSEHSAIFQSLVGEGDNEVEKLLLTCSGGPFRNFTHEQLEKRLPIQYAFSFPQRLHLDGERLDLFKTQDLQFFKPDYKKFKCLQLAFDAIRKGGNMSCIVNAANEIVNAGFRKGECGFLQMADIIEETMAKATFDSNPDLDVYLQTDAEARRIATELMHK